MAFWHRLNQSRLKLLSHQFKRFYVQPPYASLLSNASKPSVSCTFENPILDACKIPNFKGPTQFCNNVRRFATSVQVKIKKEEKGSSGPRLNDQIKAQFIRLVTKEGHGVVPIREALEQARNFKLDLVEVDRTVDPPVCKIMDFHKEKYVRQVKEKERAKSKSEVTLRKGDCKEVRFSAKTEQKDLKIKADGVARLMQRGYRVKCMVLGSPKKGGRALKKGDEDLTAEEIAERIKQEEEEKEGLRALLSRLTALIEEEYIIESGPRVEKKQAYVIVRHAKFGPSKKGSTKKSKGDGKVTAAQPTVDNSSSNESLLMAKSDSTESGQENEDDILSDEDNTQYDEDDVSDELEDDKNSWSVTGSTNNPSIDHRANSSQMNFGIRNILQVEPVQDSKRSNGLPSSPQPSPVIVNRYKPQPFLGNDNGNNLQPFPATENRYRPQPSFGSENRYSGSGMRQPFPPSTSRDGREPEKINSFEPRYSPRSSNPSMGDGESRPVRTDYSSAFRSMKLHPETSKNSTASSGSGSAASSFGIFSSPKGGSPGK